MKKTLTIVVVALVIVSLFTGCAESATTPTTTSTTTSTTTPATTSTTVQKYSSFEEIAEYVEPTPPVDYTDLLKEMVSDLEIGFSSYGFSVKVDGKTAFVSHAEEGWALKAMFPSRSFLEEHKVTFTYEGPGSLERFTPPTKEKEELQGDDWGYTTPDKLDTNIGIRGFVDGTLTITVDDEFTIIVNP